MMVINTKFNLIVYHAIMIIEFGTRRNKYLIFQRLFWRLEGDIFIIYALQL